MTRFSARTEARAVVAADRGEIWTALTDPTLVARMTPFVTRISERGEHWFWEMSRLQVAGVGVAPSFTEQMTFTDKERIEFHHDPPRGEKERAGAYGWYDLTDHDDGTLLSTRLEIGVDLPLPRAASPAVTATMRGVMGQMGDRFSRNLLDHLGLPG
jgi:carbon monoxide dehydrogenase subunit G